MRPYFEIVDISPDLQPLFHALAESGVGNRLILQTVARLTQPPESLHIPTSDRTELANSVLKTIVGFDEDMAARMLRLDEGAPDAAATWKGLTRAERKRAKHRWDWALDAGLDTAPQGRPPAIDSALVIYCARVLAEACGKQAFKFSRPTDGGAPYGPMWRALMLALPMARESLASGAPVSVGTASTTASTENSDHAETVAEIVTAARSSKFTAKCCDLGLGATANDVAQHPATFRYAVMFARRPGRRPQRTRPVP
jgi:hypothetical protein